MDNDHLDPISLALFASAVEESTILQYVFTIKLYSQMLELLTIQLEAELHHNYWRICCLTSSISPRTLSLEFMELKDSLIW